MRKPSLSGRAPVLRLLILSGLLGLSACQEAVEAPRANPGEASVSNPAPGLVSPRQLNVDEAFELEVVGGQVHGENTTHGFEVDFESSRTRVRLGTDSTNPMTVAMRVRSSGREMRPESLEGIPAQITSRRNRADIHWPNLEEWFLNGPMGLEQGWTLHASPEGEGVLTLELGVEGDLQPVLVGTEVDLLDASGQARLHYGALRAIDSAGRRLSSALAVADGSIVIRVDDEGASYPVMIDPILVRHVDTLAAADRSPGDEFGGTPISTAGGPTVAIDGDVAVVAATFDEARAGAVYVFRNGASGWAQEAKLTRPSGLNPNARFGYSVAVQGDTLVVGAPLPLAERGKAFVYTHSGGAWAERAMLESDTAGDAFGTAVALDGGTIAVGARYSGTGGEAFVFTGGGASWSLQQRLAGADTAVRDDFGSSIALDGDTLVVGSVFHPVATRAGAAYVFTRSGGAWSQRTKLVAGDAASLDLFARSLDLNGNRLVIGAPQNQVSVFGQGAAYVFEGSGSSWTQTQRLTRSSPEVADQFGYSVGTDGDFVVAGARFVERPLMVDAGAIFAFQRVGGTFGEETLHARPSAAAGERFGDSVALSGTTAIASAPFADARAGAVDIVDLCGGCVIEGICVADGSANPANACEVCDADAESGDWTARADASACDDGLFCTTDDACVAGVCTGGARDCSDGLSCTTDSCNDAADRCENPLASGCLIEGTCVAEGASNPANSCEACRGAIATSSWSALPDSTVCDDGLFCTVDDSCRAGSCAGGVRDCGDGLTCTNDTCDESSDRCESSLTTGCLIDGSCVDSLAFNPENNCQACVPEVSDSDYSNLPDATLCSDPSCAAGVLTPASMCAGGACTMGAPIACPGGALCADELECAGGCTDDAMCAAASYCDVEGTGACVADETNGTDCSRNEMCASGLCVDGVCCEGACDGTCVTCALTGSEGTCNPIPAMTDPEDECELSCDGSGACEMPEMDAGVPDGGMDGGISDAGVDASSDASVSDAEVPDAATDDGGVSDDGGTEDGGAEDGGAEDSGAEDSGVDGGEAGASGGACGCATTSPEETIPGAAMFLLALFAGRRRRRSV